MKRPLRRNRNVFRFKDLPRELRDQIYADTIDRTTSLEFQVSHRFNSKLPLVDRQINREASSVIYAIPDLVFQIDSFDALNNLPLRLKRAELVPSFQKCRLDFFVTRRGLLDGKIDSGLPALRCLPDGNLRKTLSAIAQQLTNMPYLEDLEIEFCSVFPKTDTEHRSWPEDLVDCFGVLRGFKEVTIKGDFEGGLGIGDVRQLESLMTQPRVAKKDRHCESTDQQGQDGVPRNSKIISVVVYGNEQTP